MYLDNNNVKLDNKDGYETDVVNNGGRKKSLWKVAFQVATKKLEQNNLILLIMKHK